MQRKNGSHHHQQHIQSPPPSRVMTRRSFAVGLVLIFLLSSTSQVVFANSNGKIGSSSSGCSCHSNSSPISPSLSGLPWGAGGYTPGSTYSLVWDGGPHVSGDGGFNMLASAGGWSNLGTDVQLMSGELTHSSDASRSWTADWTAPSAGTGDVDFDLAVLYANGNSQNSGDSWGTGTWTLSEAGPTNNPPSASNVTTSPVIQPKPRAWASLTLTTMQMAIRSRALLSGGIETDCASHKSMTRPTSPTVG